MTYKPEQLPFAEFDEVAKKLRLMVERLSPHYPIIVEARDANGQKLMHQRFVGPRQKSTHQVMDDVGEWDAPVTVFVRDESTEELIRNGMADEPTTSYFHEVLEKVTPQDEVPVNLRFF
jgi:hypothetical protein